MFCFRALAVGTSGMNAGSVTIFMFFFFYIDLSQSWNHLYFVPCTRNALSFWRACVCLPSMLLNIPQVGCYQLWTLIKYVVLYSLVLCVKYL